MLRSVGQTLWGIVTRQPAAGWQAAGACDRRSVTDRIIVTPRARGLLCPPPRRPALQHRTWLVSWRGSTGERSRCGAFVMAPKTTTPPCFEDLMPPRGVPPESDTPIPEAVWQVCFSVQFFWDWDEAHVAVLCTDSGTQNGVGCGPTCGVPADVPRRV